MTQRVIIVEEELPTLHSTEVARLLPVVVKELRSLQKYTTSAGSRGETAHSSEVTRLVLLVDVELPTLQK